MYIYNEWCKDQFVGEQVLASVLYQSNVNEPGTKEKMLMYF